MIISIIIAQLSIKTVQIQPCFSLPKEDRHTASGVALPLAEKHTLHHQHHLLQPSSAQTVTVCGEARPIFVVWDTNDTFCPDERDRT